MLVAVMRQLRRPSALLVATLVFAASAAALVLLMEPTRTPIAHDQAVSAVLHHPQASRALARGEQWTEVRVSAVDRDTARVTFFGGERIFADVALARDGSVDRFVDYRGLDAPYGAPLSHNPWVIALGCLVFVLATAVAPLWRMRNLDVLALLALVVPMLLLDERFLAASTLTAVPPLAWLAGRCAWFALRRPRRPRRRDARTRPLADALTPAWSESQRVRILRVAVASAGAAVAMITLSAPFTVDVGQALMEGATLLRDGVLPYGHMPGDVYHGDTYPLLSYLVYVPLAIPLPVRDDWDVADGALLVAAASALAVAWMLVRAHAGSAGLRAALAWLLFPPLLVAVSSGTSDVLLGALIVGALLLASQRRVASTGVLIVAGWFKLVPFALLPIWLARLRGRQLLAALALLAASAAATVALLVALGGRGAPGQMLDAMTFQLERRSLHSPWTLLGIEWLQPLVQAGVLALIAAATLRTWREPAFAQDPARLAALTAAVLLGLQLAGHYWTYLYLAWVVPCIALSLLAGVAKPAEAPARAPVRAREPLPA